MGLHFNAAMFAAFTGLEERHVAAILGALEAHGAVPKAKVVATNGTRLPPDFKMPAKWIEWAIEERHWTPDDTETEAAKFCDYWISKPKDASKLDWLATWRNWVRNSSRTDGNYYPQAAITQSLSHTEHMEKTAAFYEKVGRLTEAADIRKKLAETSNVIVLRAAG